MCSVLKEMKRIIDSRKLLLAVKKHLTGWNSRFDVKKWKLETWCKLASEVIDNWTELNRSERLVILRFLAKCVNHIRNYTISKSEHGGQRLKKQNSLNFLLTSPIEFKNNTLVTEDDNRSVVKPWKEKVGNEEVKPQIEEENDNEAKHGVKEVNYKNDSKEDTTFFDSLDDIYEECNSSIKQESLYKEGTSGNHVDPDLMFLRSLLPDMKRLRDEDKFSFKLAIMQAYLDILSKRT